MRVPFHLFLCIAMVPALQAQGLRQRLVAGPVVVLTNATDLRTTVEQLPALRQRGFEAAVITGAGCVVGRALPASLPALRAVPGTSAVLDHGLSPAALTALPAGQRDGVRYLGELLDGAFETPAVRSPMDWSGHPDHALETPAERGGPMHPASGNDRLWVPQAQDWTCGNSYNSEVMEGVIVASTFFIESNGTIDADLYSWNTVDLNSVKSQLIDAWTIWSYTASLYGRTVTAVMDWYEPAGGVPVQGYEPVTRASTSDALWIDAIMANAGRTEVGAFGKLYAFNHERRAQLGADRSFSAFVAYNPGTAPSQFTDGKIGYAYLGGPYTQILWRANGWLTSQVNRVYGHEVGHIFHAFDEYATSSSSNCGRSFNGRPNSNYQGSTCNGTAACVMINNAFNGSGAARNWQLCAHTPHHLGWLGTLVKPVSLAPRNDSLVSVNPVVLRVDRSAPPSGTSCYVKVFDRNTDTLVYCGTLGSADTLALPLVNGAYRWTASVGNASTGSGYAGTIGDAALFRVEAPLTASFGNAPNAICAGATVVYTNASTGGPSSWTWSFPGGTPSGWVGRFPPPVRYLVPGAYPATLTVDDGFGTSTFTLSTAVTVSGGAALPFREGFGAAPFPPAGWTAQGGYGGQGGSPLNWTGVTEGSCGQGTAASAPAFAFTGGYASPVLRSPRVDLTQATMPYLRFRYAYGPRVTSGGGRLAITANNCNYTRYAELFNAADAALATNGGALQTAAAWSPATCGDWRDVLVRLDSLSGHVAELAFRFTVMGTDQDLHLDDVQVFEGVRPKVRALLDGPYDAQVGLMRDDLRTAGLVPLVEPYSALGFAWKGEGGGQTTTPAVLNASGADAIVDWVVLEVRDSADATKVLASRPALIQRDGDLVDVDGVQGPRMPVAPGQYHLAVHHRNHLPVCTAFPVAVGAAQPLVDLSQPSAPVHGIDARRVQNGRATLWSGDAQRDLVLRYTGASNDRDAVLLRIGGVVPTSMMPGYWSEDTNLDGVVKYTGMANDRDPILFNIGGSVPTNTRAAQLP